MATFGRNGSLSRSRNAVLSKPEKHEKVVFFVFFTVFTKKVEKVGFSWFLV